MVGTGGPLAPASYAAQRIYNATWPVDGPKCMTLAVDFSFNASQGLKLENAIERGVIDFVQAMYIDNTASNAPVIVTVKGTNQRLIWPAGSYGAQPVYCPNPPHIDVSCADATQTSTLILLLNIPVPTQMTYTTASTVSTLINTSQVSVTGTATSIIAVNATRKGLIVKNAGSQTVYLDETSGVLTTTGYPLLPGDTLNFDNPNYVGALFGITAGTTVSIGVMEINP